MKIMGRSGIPDILQFKRMLRDKDLKATPQRMAVHEAMSALGHAAAEEVSQWIAEHGEVSVSPASVYNILSTLADLGIYGRCSGRGGKRSSTCGRSSISTSTTRATKRGATWKTRRCCPCWRPS